MASVNKVILVGNLGRNPEVRYTPDGAAVCRISIATTRSWKDGSSGQRVSETEWHQVILYNRLAEVAGEYLAKGRSVYIEGHLKTRKWQERSTGADRYSTEIIADQMQMLGRLDDATRGAATQPANNSRPAVPAATSAGASLPDDDIPFAPYAARHATHCI